MKNMHTKTITGSIQFALMIVLRISISSGNLCKIILLFWLF